VWEERRSPTHHSGAARIAAYPDSSFTSNERAHRFDLRMVLSMEGIQCHPNWRRPGSPVRMHQERAERNPCGSHAHEDRENQDLVVVHGER